MFTDIHNHTLYGVDDGSKTLEQSLIYLKQAKKIGLNKIVCTPHMHHGTKEKALKMVQNFKILREEAKKLGIELYLGNEILYNDDTIKLLKEKRITTLKQTKYVLIEFKRNEKRNIDEILNILDSFFENGYIPVLAHPELYVNYHFNDIKKIKETGTILQIDANNLLRFKTSRTIYKKTWKLINERLVDIVATDTHCTKKRDILSLKKAYKKVFKKDQKYANIIFNENPSEIVGD